MEILFSIALIFLLSIILSKLFKLIKLPQILGMIAAGIILGPFALNLLDDTLLTISPQIRQIALIIILARAGMNLDIKQLKQIGRPVILICFVPACFEILAMALFAPKILNITLTEAILLGCVVGAVSPAIIVPRMIGLIEKNRGTKKLIPQMVMAGSSVDDIFVIVLFTATLSLEQTGEFNGLSLIKIPSAILLGLGGGIVCGLILSFIIKRIKPEKNIIVLIILSACFCLVYFENYLSGFNYISTFIGFSGLLATMALGATLKIKAKDETKKVAGAFASLWQGGEILLFALVGACVNINFAFNAGLSAIILILIVLIFRVLGVFVCLIKTNFNLKEKIFVAISYLPKATVQAAIGSIPLSLGLPCGNIVLTIAVLSILITAPLGAILIDYFYKKLLTTDEKPIKC